MAGPKTNGVYWFQEGFGFTTSTAYANALPDWLVRFNKSFLETVRNKSLVWEAIGPMDGKAYPGVWRAEITDTPIVSTLPRLTPTQGFPVETAPGFLLGETQDGSFWKSPIHAADEVLDLLSAAYPADGTWMSYRIYFYLL